MYPREFYNWLDDMGYMPDSHGPWQELYNYWLHDQGAEEITLESTTEPARGYYLWPDDFVEA